jgi:hypothetical protein
MKHSSRRESCPICSRNTDDKCRWNDEMIFCYDGTSFAPPQYLRLGDKVKVGLDSYALFSQACGFANNSYGFALVDDFDYRFLRYEDKRAFRKKCVSITRTFIKKRDSVFALVNALRDECVFHEMRLDEFYTNKRCTKKAISLLAALSEFAAANKRYVVDYLAQVKETTEHAERLQAMLDSIYNFERLHFNQTYDDEQENISSAELDLHLHAAS